MIGDGSCDAELNNAACGYDGGDCCYCTCSGSPCFDFDCLDPTATEDEFYDCKARPPTAPPCTADVQQAWEVGSSEQAQALAAAVNCSGGSFEVEWRGRVVVDESIYVADGTVLTISGTDTGAVIDGNAATRLFTVVGATLHLSDVNITSGSSMILGGAIAAARSAMTFNRTYFDGNNAFRSGGAVFVSDGSNVSCAAGGAFVNNSSGFQGGAMFVTGGSEVSCGGSWVGNTATFSGGALFVGDNSKVSWTHEAIFAANTAEMSGGAVFVFNGSSMSWSGATTFDSNSAVTGGAVIMTGNSTVSWSSSTTFSKCDSLTGGALYSSESSLFWSGSTAFASNTAITGAAVYASGGSSTSWTGTTEFTSNTGRGSGGAVALSTLDSLDTVQDAVLVVNGSTTFSNNSCGTSGGALAVLGGVSVVVGTVDVSFINNTADVAGGAVFVSGAGVGPVFPGVRFVSNSAQVGGAVSAVGSGFFQENGETFPTTLKGCHFVDNRASATGGAIESAAGQDVFLDCVFEDNKAGTGGALRLAGTSYMENCSFVDNISDQGGGAAVSNIGSISEMENNSFSGNVFNCEPGMFLSYSEVCVGVRARCSRERLVCVRCARFRYCIA